MDSLLPFVELRVNTLFPNPIPYFLIPIPKKSSNFCWKYMHPLYWTVMNAQFIVLEGPDGSGSTLHGKLLLERMQKEGIDAIFTWCQK